MTTTDEDQYLSALADLSEIGVHKQNRTSVVTRGLLGAQHRYNLSGGTLPLFTTKKVWLKGVAVELLWMLRGETSLEYLHQHGVHIWDQDAKRFQEQVPGSPALSIGLGYGYQWRSFEGVDQVQELLRGLREQPESRRHLLTAWHPGDLPHMALPPCHVLSQYSVVDGRLTCHMYQRSADMFLGVPFNVASYALLTHLLSKLCGLEAGELIHTLHDYHLYDNHVAAARVQLTRYPRPLPTVEVLTSPGEDLDRVLESKWDSLFQVSGYNPHPPIQAELVTS